jgi:hypothetical protein
VIDGVDNQISSDVDVITYLQRAFGSEQSVTVNVNVFTDVHIFWASDNARIVEAKVGSTMCKLGSKPLRIDLIHKTQIMLLHELDAQEDKLSD